MPPLRTFAFAVALAAAQAPATPAGPLPLVVERVEILPADTASGQPAGAYVTLFNAGSKTIHAFGFRTEVTRADGRIDRGGVATDRYENPDEPQGRVSMRGDCGGALPPGRRCTMWTTPGGVAQAVSAAGFATFAIFADNTAVGDEAEIAFYFQQRALNHRAWPVIERIVANAVARGGDPQMALFDIREELGRVKDGEVRASRSFQTFDRMLALNIKLPQLKHAEYLRAMLDDARARRARAEAHHQRKLDY